MAVVQGQDGLLYSLIPMTEAGKKGKQPKLGTGKRFAKLVKSIEARGGVTDPAAVAAKIGRAKFGKEKFQKLAQAGRKRARKAGK